MIYKATMMVKAIREHFYRPIKELITLYLKEGLNHGKDELEKRLTKHLFPWNPLVLQKRIFSNVESRAKSSNETHS